MYGISKLAENQYSRVLAAELAPRRIAVAAVCPGGWLLAACPPARLPACLPARLPACLPTCLPACPPACPPACLPARLPACLPAIILQ